MNRILSSACFSALSIALLLTASCGNDKANYDSEHEGSAYTDSESNADKKEAESSSPKDITLNSPAPISSSGTYKVLDASGVTAASGLAEQSQSQAPPPPPEPAATAEPASSIKIPEKIIKTANITCRVENYKKARTEIERIVKKSNGYIASENEYNNSDRINNYVVIRVLNKDFDALVTNLTGIAKEVTNKNISTRDVTAEFVDIQTRLKTKKEIEKRYIELLQKATKIQDILDIEEKIRVLREEIEAKEGELKYLSDQVSYSTINLNFYETYEYEPSERPGFWNRLANSMGSGWKGFLNFLVGFAGLWPLWLILGIVGYVVYKFLRGRIKKA